MPMTPLIGCKTGRCRWIDLAASDAGRAQSFYEALFGWTVRTEQANGGVFTCLQVGDEELARSINCNARTGSPACRRIGRLMSRSTMSSRRHDGS